MKREDFLKVVEEALDSLPREFLSRIRNVAVLVEDVPPNQPSPQSGRPRQLLLGIFHGVPTTKKSFFDLPMAHGRKTVTNVTWTAPAKGK
jgi:predicted Zn-dependent protease with MMP-like domain